MLKKMTMILWMPVVFSAVHAQDKANNHWYFGQKAGINFNTTPPQRMLDNVSVATEGTATVSDMQGQLLFYTDGDTVFDKNHQAMPNGTGLTHGKSIAQPAVIVQRPGHDSLYYIFSADGEFGHPAATFNGTFSVVNMNMNGGLGAVTDKNAFITDSVMENVLVVPARECEKYWVLYHPFGSNRFEARLFGRNGLSADPVISAVGPVPSAGSHVSILSGSPDNSLVAYTNSSDGTMLLMHFDNATGTLSELLTYQADVTYGVCFSPDNTKLYLNASDSDLTFPAYPNFKSYILQFDLNTGNPTAILASRFVVDSVYALDPYKFGQIQRAPNGVLYVAMLGEDIIPAIFNPNVSGAGCNYSRNGFDLSPGDFLAGILPNEISIWGLPAIAHVNKPVNIQKPNLGADTILCAESLTLQPKVDPQAKHTWSTGASENQITVTQSGTYWVKTEMCGQVMGDTITVTLKNGGAAFTMPNIITPNNDGINDAIDMADLLGDCATYDLKIMNRWGYVVYDNVKANPKFTGHAKNGSKLVPGVYYYVYTQGNIKKNGTISVLY